MRLRFPFLILFAFFSMAASTQYIPRFDVQGHRGARGLRPENSIPAFIAALDTGVTTLEMDVVITKDKQVVVSHEPWMSAGICYDSTGNEFSDKAEKKYNIYQMTYDEVKRFDCGSKGNEKFPQQLKMKISKPLLSDVLVAVETQIKNYGSYEVDYNIEIKSSPEDEKKYQPSIEEFSDLVYTLVDEYIPLDRLVIQSFDFRVLQYWHKKYPAIRLAALVENTKSIDANLAALGFKPSIYSPYYKLINKEKVHHLHQEKIRVIPWTVNEVSDMLSLKGMGVDGIITDYPDRARKYKMTLNIARK
ncbi:glycerophosphodiester phosphodiesterase [Chryseolinea lacunae]|uniref:Glycerophosphodiester phosphodiesterase n=1 Tax=Chryseolinea lacunae TaxID=2801331 RepID=A0ABS1KS00_9BACT|nr:glycerophosphodiester phosphodiesterase [Chryseolinea lacunae]MBL0742088.1 glycerophosphodiester phosphodiesterase [Chryseolinea lacunae]